MSYDYNTETSVTEDHIIPRVFGGAGKVTVAACEKCNSLRGTINAFKFFAIITSGGGKREIKKARREQERRGLSESFDGETIRYGVR